MAAQSTFAMQFAESIDSYLVAYVSSVSTSLTALVLPLIMGGWVIYTLVFGFAILRGDVQSPIGAFVWKSIKVLIILGAGLGVGIGQIPAIGLVDGFASSMAVHLSGGLGGGGGLAGFCSTIDAYLSKVGDAGDQIILTAAQGSAKASSGGWMALLTGDIGPVILAIITGLLFSAVVAVLDLFAIVVAACALLMFLGAQISLTAVLAVSPLFIASLCFEKTAKFFDGWLSQVLNYCLVIGFTGMVLGITAFILDAYLVKFQAGMLLLAADPASIWKQISSVFAHLFAIVGVDCMCAWFFFQIPGVASGLVGGSGMSNPVSSGIRFIQSSLSAAAHLRMLRGKKGDGMPDNRIGGK